MDALRIAVCEDEQKEREALRVILEETGVPVSCSFYPRGEELLEAFYPGCFDLILMDIYMDGMNGVETVERIRAADPRVCIAFLTSSPDFTMEGYRNRVERYLLKPAKKEDVAEAVHLACQTRRNRPSVSLTVQGRERLIPCEAISYAEQNAHSLVLHLAGGDSVKAVMKLSTLAGQLPSPPFYQFHKSFLVNLSHVRCYDGDLKAFLMDGGGCAYIRRDSLRQAQDAYSRFMFDQLRYPEDP